MKLHTIYLYINCNEEIKGAMSWTRLRKSKGKRLIIVNGDLKIMIEPLNHLNNLNKVAYIVTQREATSQYDRLIQGGEYLKAFSVP